ncbi:CRISPR-associated endoribonuclease Cas6 [Abyssisolibacter fermentans]|uniref:CRISPR-associated endoribonuclease Cas6 n=1 Tax=Abyssisolibacter fermentans TaxID=1766203 RepID=UPI00083086F3|nr:CRISPR-associated endoribonuclease Cas6 [Abyssisolibacter fermentans]
MNFYELRTTVFVKKDIHFRKIGYTLARHINYCMTKSDYLKELHIKKLPKLYCFDYLYPFEKDKIYSKGKVYVFRIRTPIDKIAQELRRTITFVETDEFKPLGVELRVKKFYSVEQMNTVTPAIATINNMNWTKDDNMDDLWSMIDNNLHRKAKMIFNDLPELKESPIEFLEQKNHKAVVMEYKHGKVLGNKFFMRFKQDDISQKLAYTALTCGLLEKASSVGAGFCNVVRGR